MNKTGTNRYLWICLVCVLSMWVADPAFAGLTVTGLSGTLLVPGLDVMPRGGARAGTHLIGTTASNEGSFKGVYSYSDDTEIGVMKRFVSGGASYQYDPVLSAKFKVRPNLALAGIIDTTPGFKDSVMLISGVPGNRIVLGLGANISTTEGDRFAHFGRYPSRFSPVDSLFFLLGASVNLDPETEMTVDYAGNDFVLGLRHNFNDRVGLDFGYYTPDRITQENRYCFGVNFGF